ncbi:MAG: hypothetical protein LC121_18015 [Anaerolineae bacterium]|nr:hypothetical protein [Anaerolineae bacterium]
MSDQAWTVLRPALADRRGRALFLSTPDGLNWFYALYMKGVRGDPGWHSFQFPTWENPYIQREEVEAARADTPELVFSQEYEAQFIDATGMVFRDVAQACTGQPEGARDGHTYVFGVDWGRLNDFTAISVIDATEKRQVALGRFTGIGWELQRARLLALYDEYRPSVIWAEENSIGQPNIEAPGDGLPVKPFR